VQQSRACARKHAIHKLTSDEWTVTPSVSQCRFLHTQGMKAYKIRRLERGHNQSDPGDLGWIVICSIDGGPFVPLKPSWEYDSEISAQAEADRLNTLESSGL
jgi:hypothetical protein